jgi:hypothetical protein
MSTMSKKIKRLESLWWDWLSTAERMLRSLHEQTAALVLRDLERIERIQPEIDAFASRLQEIDEEALACAKELAEELGAEPHLRGLVQALDKAQGQAVQAMANRVIVTGRHVQEVTTKNRALIESELEYINGTLALVAQANEEAEGPYRRKRPGRAVVMNQAA